MMKHLLSTLVLVLAWAFSSQAQQGFPSLTSLRNEATYAVVIGISDYQDPAITNLSFAHRDAEAFAEWLQSPAGGEVPQANIQLMLNENATMGRVAMAFWELMTKCKEGDQAIIYFSGHGDVEAKVFSQPGYWLCWDAPPYAYMSGGCFNVRDLQVIVSTLSLQNKARVTVISDACHAGKLAGSSVGGPQITASNISQQFANEVKILSCQPDEISIEGRQWGGGRGCFSYHLTRGLYGFADRNGDDIVTLFELETYLGEKVPAEADPHSQFPFAVGDKRTTMAFVDNEVYAQVRSGDMGRLSQGMERTDPRGIADWIAQTDSNLLRLYLAFNDALDRNALLAPEVDCADYYYRRLIGEPAIEPLHGLMTRNFAAALIDESQQVTNKILKSDPHTLSETWARPFVFDHIPAYLERACEILGERHFLFKSLRAKQLFFEAQNCLPDKYPDIQPDSIIRLAARKYEEALNLDSLAAYVHVEYSYILWHKLNLLKQAQEHALRALELSPNWVYANYFAGITYRYADTTQAFPYLLRAIELDSTFLLPYHELGFYYFRIGYIEKYEYFIGKFISKVEALIASAPESVPALYRLQLGAELWRALKPGKALKVLLELESLSKGQAWGVYPYLGLTYAHLGMYEEALQAAKRQVELAPYNILSHLRMASLYWALGQPAKEVEEREYLLSLMYSSEERYSLNRDILNRLFLGEAYLQIDQKDAAIEQFRKVRELLPRIKIIEQMYYEGRVRFALDGIEAMRQLIDAYLQDHSEDAEFYFYVALIHAGIAGQEQEALKWLELALEKGYKNYFSIIDNTGFARIRNSPGFKKLMQPHLPDLFEEK